MPKDAQDFKLMEFLFLTHSFFSRCVMCASFHPHILMNNLTLSHTNRSNKMLRGSVKSVRVINVNSTQRPMKRIEDLPVCTLGYNSEQPEVAGYYEMDNWYPPTCQVRRFRNMAKMKKCFRNRQFFFFGDSTIRQLHEYYLDTLKLSKSFLGEEGSGYTGPVSGRDVSNNITKFFAFHKYPVGKQSWTYDKDLEYIATRINNLSSSGFPVVVVSVWAHFESAPPVIYEERVRGIVLAMGKLLDRNKRAVALFKSGNTRQIKSLGQHACCSDWYARGTEERMRKIIFRDKRIGFIDAWDMTHAQLLADDAHPKGSHVANMNDQLLTFLGCS
ncbi:NXPE family member 3-like [Lytechinus pictus]|uniref:NXPE family member 3-like n=1 Tax=Lytechinus pictus TaxID=7653 RepID=UPI0030B9D334